MKTRASRALLAPHSEPIVRVSVGGPCIFEPTVMLVPLCPAEVLCSNHVIQPSTVGMQ